MQLAFVSRSSIGTLPLTQRVTERNLGVPRAYASFAVPLGATTKMDGCAAIYPAIAAIFVAQFFGIQLDFTQYLLIALVSVLGSAATAGTTGAVVMLTLTLSTLGLPLAGVGLLLAIDPILDMGRTAVNVAGQALVPAIVAKRQGILDETLYNAPRNGDPFSDDVDDTAAVDPLRRRGSPAPAGTGGPRTGGRQGVSPRFSTAALTRRSPRESPGDFSGLAAVRPAAGRQRPAAADHALFGGLGDGVRLGLGQGAVLDGLVEPGLQRGRAGPPAPAVRSSSRAAVTLASSMPSDFARDAARAFSIAARSGFCPSAGGVAGLLAWRKAFSASATLASSTPSLAASSSGAAAALRRRRGRGRARRACRRPGGRSYPPARSELLERAWGGGGGRRGHPGDSEAGAQCHGRGPQAEG